MGGFRIPLCVRWPGTIKPGTVYNNIISHEDWMPTLLAAAGDPDVVKKVAEGYKVGGKTFKQHLDGYNFLPFFQGKEEKSPRHEIFYFDQAGNLLAVEAVIGEPFSASYFPVSRENTGKFGRLRPRTAIRPRLCDGNSMTW
jgi:arylsulfatase A-like enzyme